LRNVDGGRDRIAQVEILRVAREADDLLVGELLVLIDEGEVPPQRALSREIAAGEGLVHDDGGGGLALGVPSLEVAAGRASF
jgi:hypothetical protein